MFVYIPVIYTLFSFPFLCTRPPLTSLNLLIFYKYMFCTSYTIFVWFERKQSSSSAETQKHQQKKKQNKKNPRKMYDINRMKYQRVCRGFQLEIRLAKCSSNYQKKRTLSMKLDPCERDTN